MSDNHDDVLWSNNLGEGRREALRLTRLYFAYGSNMNSEQMKRRCPHAKVVARATLKDWKVVARGVADIIQSKGDVVHGLLWHLTEDCLRSLDVYEGYPTHYDRRLVTVQAYGGMKENVQTVQAGSGTWNAWVYKMTREYRTPQPLGNHYATGCAIGALEHRIPVDEVYIQGMETDDETETFFKSSNKSFAKRTKSSTKKGGAEHV